MRNQITYNNKQWLQFLSQDHKRFNECCGQLNTILLKALKASFRKRMPIQVLEELCQDALIRILSKISQFKGESSFLSWAIKIAVNLTLTELRRKHWKDYSIEEIRNKPIFQESIIIKKHDSPEQVVMKKSILEMITSLMKTCLSKKQQLALSAVIINNTPLEIIAEQLDSNRNAVYKLLHDARKKIKQEMEESGQDINEILKLFS